MRWWVVREYLKREKGRGGHRTMSWERGSWRRLSWQCTPPACPLSFAISR